MEREGGTCSTGRPQREAFRSARLAQHVVLKSLRSTAHSVGYENVDKEQKEGEKVDGLRSGEKGDHVGLRRE